MSDNESRSAGSQETGQRPGGPSAQRRSILMEFLDYLMSNKKWWMIPIVVVVLLLCLLLVFTSTPAAPFIYALF
jgi:hypothetical protein